MEQERRTSGGQRVPFEALVVVASPKGGAGAYECEAVNLSENGMHLRTAYLPEHGQTLSFRFETGSGEVTLEGQVVWREEQARGGEFGVRFAPADEAALGTIRRALGLDEAPADGPDAAPHRATRGSRVRLHIDGLNSPMRARVRDDHTGEVLVGSNLDFLKVGKPLELEDVDQGQRRGAVVDKVEVEVDPASKVPQLVVTLRYEDAGAPADEARKAAGVASSGPADRAAARAALAASGAEAPAEAPAADEGDALPIAPSPFGKLRDALGQAGAKLPVLGASARVALGSLVERVRARREQEQTDDAPTPRRVTAPAPDGGVSVIGGRRQQSTSAKEDAVDNGNGDSEHEELSGLEETDEESLKIRKKQRVMIAAGAGLLAILLVVFGVRARSSNPPGDTASAESPAATLAAVNAGALPGALPGASLAAPGALGSADAVSANVPLFGTTPLTTTEAAPLPAPAVGAPGTLAQANPAAAGGDGDEEPAAPGKTEFGKGDVKKPRTVRIKMDAPITDLRGNTTDDTITLFLPGRRNVEPASPLLKRDKRLSAVKAVPKDGGLEVSLAFKDEAPPFLAKANGKMLEIDLGQASAAKGGDDDGESDDTVAAKKGHGKKKVAKGAKAAGSKKSTAKKADKKAGKKARKHSSDD